MTRRDHGPIIDLTALRMGERRRASWRSDLLDVVRRLAPAIAFLAGCSLIAWAIVHTMTALA